MRLRTRDAEIIGLPWLSMTCATAVVIVALLMFRAEFFDTFQAYLSQRGRASSPIDLRVSRADGDLRIAWSKTARAVLSARTAALAITDGERRYVVHLSREELGAGQVVYQPVSPEVAVRVDIEDGAGRRTTETASVLGLPVRARGVVAADQRAASAQSPPPPEIVRQPVQRQALLKVPTPPPSALRTIRGAIHVDTNVRADATGAVRSASLVSPGRSAYFAKMALAAARASRLPAGVQSAVLHYEFSPSGVRVTRR